MPVIPYTGAQIVKWFGDYDTLCVILNFEQNMPLRKVFLWTAIVGVFLNSTQILLVTGYNRTIGVSDQLFAICDSVALTVLGQVIEDLLFL